MKVDLNTLLFALLVIFLGDSIFKRPVQVSPYTIEDIERAERSAKREVEFNALKKLVELDEKIIEEDEKLIDSNVNFVAIHYRSKRDSLRAIAFGN